MIVLGFNDTLTLVGHFVSSPRETEERDKRDSRGDEREGQGRKKNRNEREETEEIKTLPFTLTCYKVPISVGRPRWRKIHDTFAIPNHRNKMPSCNMSGVLTPLIFFSVEHRVKVQKSQILWDQINKGFVTSSRL